MLVAGSEPLDQYIVRNPDFFLGASPEHARIDPDQLLVLLDHVRCAAFELPFHDGEQFGSGGQLDELLAYLRDEGVVHREDDAWHWITDSYPANAVSLRSVAEGNFVVIDHERDGRQIIAEVDFSSAPETLYEGAIYMLQASPYQVETLDWEGRKAYVRPTRADYYTDAVVYTRLKILERLRRAAARQARVGARRGAPGAAFCRLQEDPLLQPREHRLRQHQSAGSGDAHHGGLVGDPPGATGAGVRVRGRWRWTVFSAPPTPCIMSRRCSDERDQRPRACGRRR